MKKGFLQDGVGTGRARGGCLLSEKDRGSLVISNYFQNCSEYSYVLRSGETFPHKM